MGEERGEERREEVEEREKKREEERRRLIPAVCVCAVVYGVVWYSCMCRVCYVWCCELYFLSTV